MTWDARQRGMLEAMGLRVWGAPAAPAVATAELPGPTQSPAAVSPPTLPVPQREALVKAASPPLHSAHWMVVGEPQSAPDAANGLPFTGDAGRLLDNMLRAIGLGRSSAGGEPASQAFLTHAMKSSPPTEGTAPYLQPQIAQVQPQIILAMGAFAVQALLGSAEPVGKLRGRVHRCEGVPVIVTYDPAYLLRSPADKAGAWADLCLARDTLAQSAGPQ